MCILALAFSSAVTANPVALPDATPTPPPLAAPSPTSACTTYLTEYIPGFTGAFTPEVVFTVYTTTDTVYTRVPCNGCSLSITTKLSPFYGGVGPEEIITSITTAQEALNITSTICSPSPTDPAISPGRQIPRDDQTVENVTVSDCTYTKKVPLPLVIMSDDDNVKTVTAWTATETSTSHIDCSGCKHVAVSTIDLLHPGPVLHFTSTTTTTPTGNTGVTMYKCLKTPSIVTPSGMRTLPIEPTMTHIRQ
ncbi:hypothetical protein QBC46DRAFT_307526 [Diplogelasinospora grovesii]|uniref:Uncharacterized protein n=1 Tax=Diplogelasinospora grovesii TaxID=303347 RepID=A0AAN6NCE5_9PEZI|nr:hypothetical protein QBC46DRAFT_307526 [Diplogelasinospora grovesii]